MHKLAELKGGKQRDEGYLSTQLSRVKSVPVHKDSNNHSHSWLTALGNFEGGRFWLEGPLGVYPPPVITEKLTALSEGELLRR